MIAGIELPQSPTLEFERPLWKDGFTRIAGIDEAGRGAWAGPVAAAVVILPCLERIEGSPDPSLSQSLYGVRDSKQMTPRARESWAPRIKEVALAWGIGFASADEIDAMGIVPATRLAAMRAIESLSSSPDYLLTDYLVFPEIIFPQAALIKGDRRSLSIAAASVLAKTARDALMCELDIKYPDYGFARHKGYGTRLHQDAIRRMGVCAFHRKSFAIQG
jgi:ribonuclease HII